MGSYAPGRVECPHCKAQVPAEFRYCGFCSRPLRSPEPESVPEERKVVTILFCDMVDFTASSEHADPEDVRARVAPYFAHLRAAAEAYGGTVEKYIGDAIAATFGTPHAHEDDPERAVRAGLRILREIQDLNATDPMLKLRVRIGIHTGEVLARLSPWHDESQGQTTGIAVNMASRLQGVAPEDGIVVSEATYIATKDIFEYQTLGTVMLKGIGEAVAIWRPIRARTPLGVDITRTHTTPLVGRSEELQLLDRTFARAVKDVSVQTVTIVGEPGIGKTRLLVELHKYLDSLHDIVRWRQGRCLPYGDGITFWALAEIVKAEARIYDSDDPTTVASKLSDIVPEGPDAPWFVERLQPLVGLAAQEASLEENFAAWRQLLEHLAEQLPSVFVFEDLHWADEAMLAFVEYLVEYAEGVSMLIVSTARPELYERRPGWLGGMRNATVVNLSPLSDSETVTLASSLLGEVSLPHEAHALIASRSEGNPLYTEELIGLLTEQGVLRNDDGTWRLSASTDVPLPGGIRSIIAARLDTLPTERKAMIANAAVVGDVFWSGAVAEMSRVDRDTVANALHELSRKQLVRRSRTSSLKGETEYSFWHVLIRDVAYAQVPRAARGAKHVAAATWLERIAPDRLTDLSEVLAHHYVSALHLFRKARRDQDAQAVEPSALRYLALAGDRSMGLNAPRAETHYRRALELAPPGHPGRARLLGGLAEAAQIAGNLSEASELYEQAIAAREESGEMSLAADLLLRSAVVLGYRGEVDRRRSVLDRIIEDSENQGPSPLLAKAYAEKAYSGWNTPYTEAIACADHAIALADELGLPAVRARALAFRGCSRVGLGDPGGLDELKAALTLSISLGLARQTYVSYFNLVGALSYEDPPAALEVAEEGLRFAGNRGLAEGGAWIRTFRLQAMFQVGRWQELVAEADELIAWAQPRGYVSIALTAFQPKAWVLSLTGRASEAGHFASLLGDGLPAESKRALSGSILMEVGRMRANRNEAARALQELIDAMEAEPGTLLELVCEGARRAALLERPDMLAQFGAVLKGDLTIVRHSRDTLTALSAEVEGRHLEALSSFTRSERDWDRFGNPHERAQALLGEARCLRALGRPGKVALPLHRARELLVSLGAAPALKETEWLLEHAVT